MAWRDQLREASIGGVPFVPQSDDLEIGQRSHLHEYPGRDLPYSEPLGRMARKFEVEGLLIGADYLDTLRRLREVLEGPGPHVLIHPTYGRQLVTATARIRQSTKQGGMAQITLTCTEAGAAVYPADRVDTRDASTQATATAQAQADAAFLDTYIADAPISALAEVSTTLAAELADLLAGGTEASALATSLAATLAAAIRTPNTIVSEARGAFAALEVQLGEPLRALGIYRGMLRAADLSVTPSWPQSEARESAATSIWAVRTLLHAIALEGFAGNAQLAAFPTREDATLAIEELQAGVEALQEAEGPSGQVVPDALWQAMADLEVAVVQDIAQRAAQLPRLGTFTPAAATPALVIAYRLFGDIDQEGEIVSRNSLRHPGFAPGGIPLEVILD